MSPLLYLKHELNFTLAEWKELTQKDKDDLRKYAEEEMKAKGIDVSA